MIKTILFILISVLCLCCSRQSKETTEVPDVPGKLLNGDSTNLRVLAKGKITVVNVWTVFCMPCMQEMPLLHNVYDKYKNNKDFSLVSVAYNNENELLRFLDPKDTTDPYRRFFKFSSLKDYYLPTFSVLPHGFTFIGNGAFPADTTEMNVLANAFKSYATPLTFIYDREGRLVFKYEDGLTSEAILTNKLDSIFAAPKGAK